ncbi:uncharacterized protein LOC143425703 [Xylocopa sonorina]|uniref:uncharacterized protein LOC143425703 n=1 Tax=Xylocopa sonorina TaxID=1818115 RepID=UPI00403B2151
MDKTRIVNEYLGDVKFYGQLVGMWPDQKRFAKCSMRIIIFVIITLTNIAQTSRVVVYYSLDNLTDQMPFLLLGVTTLLKEFNYVLNEEKVGDMIPSIWFSVFMFLLLPALPPVLDIVVPLNVSRERILVYPSYYFVDEQEYYYPILAHMVFSAFILAYVFIACDLNLIYIVQHACALLAISGYRFKHAMDSADFYHRKYNGTQTTEKTYAKVVESIDAHKKATEYVKKVEACHVHYFLLLVGIIIMVFTVTFVKLASVEMGSTYLTFSAFTMSQTIHLLFLTVMGQCVIDSHEETFRKIYEAQWHNGSAKAQALYVLVLRQCLNARKLTGGGMITLDLNSFVQVLKASFSYYTVLKGS